MNASASVARAGAMTMPDTSEGAAEPAYFSVRDIHAYYGESYIVQGVSFDIAEGDVVALLGRNGAGKTSTLRTLARALDPELKGGEIWLDGKAIHKLKDFRAAQHGIQLVQEDRRIIPGLTVEENLQLAQIAEPKGWPLEQIYEHFPRLAERRKQDGVTLSGGEQQMLAVARALARDIKLLLLDEPYEGLAPVIVKEIERIVHEIKQLGITTIIVEQNAVAALELSNRALILDDSSRVLRSKRPLSRASMAGAGGPDWVLCHEHRLPAGPVALAAGEGRIADSQQMESALGLGGLPHSDRATSSFMISVVPA